MPDMNARIEQFRKMAHDDPDNELAHYALGQEYLKADMYDAAIASMQRVLELKPALSRAYEALASALLKKGLRDRAIERLTAGVLVAHECGDIAPREQMMKMLSELGAPLPQLRQAAPDQASVGEGQVLCSRCHRIGPKLAALPFRNAQGREIQQKICEPCWREWVAMGTKVINELRLPMNEPQAQRIYDEHMCEFLNLQ